MSNKISESESESVVTNFYIPYMFSIDTSNEPSCHVYPAALSCIINLY